MNAVDAVQAVELVCHQIVHGRKDDLSKALLLEALDNFRATPLASFPHEVLDLVRQSHDQVDELSARILASDSLSSPLVDHDIRAVCRSLDYLARALRSTRNVSADVDEN